MENTEMSKHHRRCKSNGGDGNPSNISYVSKKKHIAWHILFTNMQTEQIVNELNKNWIDPRYHLEYSKKC